MEPLEFAIIFGAGALGALAKDIIQDGKLILPKKTTGEFALGFLGGMILGGIAGITIDGSFGTAFMGGFTGSTLLQAVAKQNVVQKIKEISPIENLIRTICKKNIVDENLGVRVAQAESALNPSAINTNTDGSRDRGLFQINEKWHPEVTDEQAFNAEFATQFFCEAVKNGNLKWWDSSKSKWEI